MTTAGEWAEGMSGLVVEHDDQTRQPKPGGTVLPATVTGVSGPYVIATAEDETGEIRTLGPLTFWAESGWKAWDGEFRWRLLPAGGEAATAAEGESR